MNVLSAGNVHARRPVVELQLVESARTTLAPDAVETLLACLHLREDLLDFPAMRRLAAAHTETPVAAAIEILAVIAQRRMNWPVRFCSWRPDRTTDGRRAVFEIGTRRVGLRAGRIAAGLLEELIQNGPGPALDELFRAQMAGLSKNTGRETPSIDALAIARAAALSGVPWSTLPGSTFVRLGLGRHAKIVMGSETSNTSSIGSKLAYRKDLTAEIFTAAGLPMARQKKVRRPEDAQAAARSIGFPVVIKPATGNMGKGVSVGVVAENAVAPAFARARAVSREVLVEALIEGDEFRLLVVDRRFIAAARRRPAHIRGDGVSTVRELIDRENARPERETILPGRMAARLPIVFDAEAEALLTEQGHMQDAVPALDEVVFLRRESNVSRGGDSIDETDRVHPSIRAVAEGAATALRIDVCGVDFISSDISRPWWETKAAICEVNTRPGLTLHSHVSEGRSHDVAADVLRMLYPAGAPSRPPIVAMLESPQTAPLRDALAASAARAGRIVGLVSSSRSPAPASAEMRPLRGVAALATDEEIDVAVVEISARDVTRLGLGLERIDLAILPHGDGSRTAMSAGAALARVAGNRVVSSNDPNALSKALMALGLPRRDEAPGPAQPAVPARARKAKQGGDRFTVLMVGDIGFGEPYLQHPRAAALDHLLKAHGHLHCFARLEALLGSADMVIGNLEAPLSQNPNTGLSGKKYLCWSDAEPAAEALKLAGIHAVSLANNHALDCGVDGLAETIARLESRGITAFGAGRDLDAASRPMIRSFSLGGNEHTLVVYPGFERRRRYDQRYRWYARPDAAGAAELSAKTIGASIKKLQGLLPRPIFVAYPHWGIDYEDVADHQRTYARRLVEAGVDLVIGHGSHTAQTIEMIGDRLVIYGLGNFVWNTPGRYTKLKAKPHGLAAALEFRADRPSEIGISLYPLLTDNSITGFQNRPVNEVEFADVAGDVSARLGRKPRLSKDAAGHHLGLDLALVSRQDQKRSRRVRAPASRAAPAKTVLGAGGPASRAAALELGPVR